MPDDQHEPMVRAAQQRGEIRRLRKHFAVAAVFVIPAGAPIAIAAGATHSTTLQDGGQPVTARLGRTGKFARHTNCSRLHADGLARGSGSALTQRLHLLETLGGIADDCRDAKELAGLIVERRDRELDRDA